MTYKIVQSLICLQITQVELLATVISRLQRASDNEDIAELERVNENLEAQSTYQLLCCILSF